MPSLLDTLSKTIFNKATVIYREQIAQHAYHIRIQGGALKDHHFIPGEHLRLFVGIDRDTAISDKLRTYSIWDHNASRGTADLAVCVHSTGIGALWATQVRVGDTIHYMGPKGKLAIDYAADSHLMISDSSALSHMYAIRRYVPVGKTSFGITCGTGISDHYPDLDGRRPFHFLQQGYDQTKHLIEAANALKDKLSSHPTIYIGGDARVCKPLSHYFRQNWPEAKVLSKGFWMPGKVGMD